jgi:hypothetical protein
MRDVRRFARDLAEIPDENDRQRQLLERREEVANAARELQGHARKAFGKTLAAWSLGIGGSWWSYSAGDPIGFALAALPLVAAAIPETPAVSAYSYLFGVQRQLIGR